MIVTVAVAAHLVLRPVNAQARGLSTYQTQGSTRQMIQRTGDNQHHVQPSAVSAQGNQQDGDTLQPIALSL